VDSFLKGHVANYCKTLESAASDSVYRTDTQSMVDFEFSRMEDHCRDFEIYLGGEVGVAAEAKEAFRDAINPWFSKSFFMSRALVKPRGYPGDYATLDGIYDNVPRSSGIGLYLDNTFLNQTLAVAVRNRKESVKRWFGSIFAAQGHDLSVLNIASGSCREWQDMFSRGGDYQGLTVGCLDSDAESLDYTSRRIEEFKSGAEFKFFDKNVLRFAAGKDPAKRQKRNVGAFGTQDVVYSIGLYDYIADDSLVQIIRAQDELLKSDGKMLLAFKDKGRYNPTCYDWVTDWRFIPRDEEDIMIMLTDRCGIDEDKISSFRDASDTVAFFDIRKE